MTDLNNKLAKHKSIMHITISKLAKFYLHYSKNPVTTRIHMQ